MNFINFLLFCLSSIGMTHIIVDGTIFQGFRDLMQKILPEAIYEIFKCYQCAGMYVGLFSGYFLLVHALDVAIWLQIIFTFLCGCAGSFLSQWGAIYLNVLEAKMIVTYKDKDDER